VCPRFSASADPETPQPLGIHPKTGSRMPTNCGTRVF
jgi:hypothetical protein